MEIFAQISHFFQILHLSLEHCHNYLNNFSDHDKLIVLYKFTKLSNKCCAYTKSVGKAYSITPCICGLWQGIATNTCLIDGGGTIPTVSCDVLNFKYTTHEVKTLAVSLCYPNNFLNSFLFTDSLTFSAAVKHHCVAVVCNHCFMLYLNVTALKQSKHHLSINSCLLD